MKKFLIILIKFYQKYISIFIPPVCRFEPSCSEYAILSLKKYNLFKALLLIIKRIIRCNPLCNGGIDYPY
ncbi:MAG TPA: membrane protein insertion efficiency factor YidD [bacterium]|nr:membrane protein insertion efficiency factor YidD [bacterium]HOL46755.1 membrane protein insertion efficiency factor YidD [bacterium]HPQ18191.1 membrane protein insertion efficiency factor YidD [bacterium]